MLDKKRVSSISFMSTTLEIIPVFLVDCFCARHPGRTSQNGKSWKRVVHYVVNEAIRVIFPYMSHRKLQYFLTKEENNFKHFFENKCMRGILESCAILNLKPG